MIAVALLLSTATTILTQYENQSAPADTTRKEDPHDWIGRRFPMLNDITAESLPAEGDWLVLLADRGCPGCRLLETKFASLSTSLQATTVQPAPRLCVLYYGIDWPVEKPSSSLEQTPNVPRLSVPSTAATVPMDRSIVHLHDSTVVQVYSPAELDLIHTVFGS